MTPHRTDRHEEQELRDFLDSEFGRLAEQPVGRGPEAGELWARAEIVRRFESQQTLGVEAVSPSIFWGPLVGALAALVVAAGLWLLFGSKTPTLDASDALVTTLGIVVGSVGVLGLAGFSTLALIWDEL